MARGDRKAIEAERARVREAERMALADQLARNAVKTKGGGPDTPIDWNSYGMEPDMEPKKRSFFRMVGNRMFRK